VLKGAASKTKIFLSGGVYGEDIMLYSTFLKDKTPAFAITYTELLLINKPDFMEVLTCFPNDAKYLRRCALKIGLRRAMLLLRCFSKCGWKFSEATRIPFAAHGILCGEIGEKYESFIHQLHPQLSALRLKKEQHPEDIQKLIHCTEMAEIVNGEAWRRDLLGHHCSQFQPISNNCKYLHASIVVLLDSIDSQSTNLILQAQRTGAKFEEIFKQLQTRAEKSVQVNATLKFNSRIQEEIIVLDVDSPPTSTTHTKEEMACFW